MTTQSPVAIVTGSSRGIGRAIAGHLVRDGFSVVVNYHSQAAAAASLVAEIQKAGGKAVAVAADVSQPEGHQTLVDAALSLGGQIDLLVNNAGISSIGRQDLLDATESSWDQVLGTNLKGPFFLTQLVVRHMLPMIEKGTIFGGKVINISSVSAFTVSTQRGDYCIAKAGMTMMTELFAARFANEGIQVFEICPGVIASDMTAPVKEKYDRLLADGLAPIRRWGTPDDVARAVTGITRGSFPYSTGMRITVDGGMHIRQL